MTYREDHPSEQIEWTCKGCGATGRGRQFLFTHASGCPKFGNGVDYGDTSMTVIDDVPV